MRGPKFDTAGLFDYNLMDFDAGAESALIEFSSTALVVTGSNSSNVGGETEEV
jgi:hypothetical protein